ncbi:hypothetical protein Scep_010236 [Stephania cephalantha]|uniref:DUF4283 domain-containing protein n=1 Tax=Stephania cephalantha TaxID=152367 RepID=A0AAP0JVP0_9MAGN
MDVFHVTAESKGINLRACQLSIIGKVATSRKVHKEGLMTTLLKAWPFKEKGPWLFDDHIFLTQQWTPELRLSNLCMSKCKIWVQVYGLPFDCRYLELVKKIGSNLGTVLAAEPLTYRKNLCDQPWTEGQVFQYSNELLAYPPRRRGDGSSGYPPRDQTNTRGSSQGDIGTQDNPRSKAEVSSPTKNPMTRGKFALMITEMTDENCMRGGSVGSHATLMLEGEGRL